jgi:hypothetical protein
MGPVNEVVLFEIGFKRKCALQSAAHIFAMRMADIAREDVEVAA